jgi:hypothetical protein
VLCVPHSADLTRGVLVAIGRGAAVEIVAQTALDALVY